MNIAKNITFFILSVAFLFLSYQYIQIKRENLELNVKVSAVKGARVADEEAENLQKEKRFEAARRAKERKEYLNDIEKNIGNFSDDQLLYYLQRMCKEDGICVSKATAKSDKRVQTSDEGRN